MNAGQTRRHDEHGAVSRGSGSATCLDMNLSAGYGAAGAQRPSSGGGQHREAATLPTGFRKDGSRGGESASISPRARCRFRCYGTAQLDRVGRSRRRNDRSEFPSATKMPPGSRDPYSRPTHSRPSRSCDGFDPVSCSSSRLLPPLQRSTTRNLVFFLFPSPMPRAPDRQAAVASSSIAMNQLGEDFFTRLNGTAISTTMRYARQPAAADAPNRRNESRR